MTTSLTLNSEPLKPARFPSGELELRLKDADMFNCERFKCDLRETICIERQKEARRGSMTWKHPGKGTPPSMYGCKDCDQGREIARKLKEVLPEARKSDVVCSEPDCGNVHHARGFCKKHYMDRLNEKYPRGKSMEGIKEQDLSAISEADLPAGSEAGKDESMEDDTAAVNGKTCKECGKCKVLEDFQPHYKAHDGRMKICRECMGKKNRKNRAGRPSKKKPFEPAPQLILENLEAYGQGSLLSDLEAAALVNVRSVEHQAIFYIMKGLEGERDGAQ